MSTCDFGHPLNIIVIRMMGGTSRMELNRLNLTSILKLVGNRKVAIISIAGPSRKGKSFLLCFLLRYLRAFELKGQTDSNWLNESSLDSPLLGFSFRNGMERETIGFWLWSKPFFIKNSNDEEIAILIMDTQGVFDCDTTVREWSAIVGLSLLTSSCLIYNVVNNLQEDTLQYLETFMEYGIIAMDDSNSSNKFFQKLILLIRDWNIPGDCDYGLMGGSKFLQSMLKINPQMADASRNVRQTIKRCFEDVNCYLMPDPGEKAKDNRYDGSLNGLTEKYIKYLKGFIEGLLNPSNTPVKTIGGIPVTGKDLLGFFDKYIRSFNELKPPTAQTLLQATAEATADSLVSKAKTLYLQLFMETLTQRGYVIERELNILHSKYSTKAEEVFSGAKMFRFSKITDKYKRKMHSEISIALTDIKRRNSEAGKLVLKALISDVDTLFKENMKAFIETFPVSEDEFDVLSSRAKESAVSFFNSKITELDPNLVETCHKAINENIELANKVYLQENRSNNSKAEEIIKVTLKSALGKYINGMKNGQLFSPGPFIAQEKLKILHDKFRAEAMRRFGNNQKSSNKDLISGYTKQLMNEIDQEFKKIEAENEENRKNIDNETKASIDSAVQLYRLEVFKLITQTPLPDISQLWNIHRMEKKKCMGKFTADCKFDTISILQQYKEELKLRIVQEYDLVKAHLMKDQDEIKRNAISSIEISKEGYIKKMHLFISTPKMCSEPELQEIHTETRLQSANNLLIPTSFSETQKQETFDKLLSEIDKEFEDIKMIFQTRLQDAKDKTTHFSVEAITQYQQKMRGKLAGITDGNKVLDVHLNIRETVLKQFTANTSFVHEGMISDYQSELERQLDEDRDGFVKEVELKQQHHNLEANALSSRLLESYINRMESRLNSSRKLSEDALYQCHEITKDIFLNRLEPGIRNMNVDIEKLEEELKIGIDDWFDRKKNKYLRMMEATRNEYENNFHHILLFYNDEMEKAVENINSELEFVSKHKIVKNSCRQKLSEKAILDEDLRRKFKLQISKAFSLLLTNFKENQKKDNKVMQDVLDTAKSTYSRKIESAFKNDPSMKQSQLLVLHKSCLEEAGHTFYKLKRENQQNSLRNELAVHAHSIFEMLCTKNSVELSKIQSKTRDIIKELKENHAIRLRTVEDTLKLNTLHQELKREAMESLCRSSNIIKDDETVKPSLNSELDSIYSSWVNELNNREPDAQTTKQMLDVAKRLYNEEMEIILPESKCMHPKALQQHHRKTIQWVEERVAMQIRLTSKFRAKLQHKLNDFFDKFHQRNKMNQQFVLEPAIGIDLGTTYSCVAVYDLGEVTVIQNDIQEKTTPSYVSFVNGKEIVGHFAKKEAFIHPANTIFDIKRLIGRRWDEKQVQDDIQVWPFTVVNNNGLPNISIEGTIYPPEQISAKVLSNLKHCAENYLNRKVKNVVITVPANFNDGQRQATRDAAKIAHLRVLAILNEPTSAGIVYSLKNYDDDLRHILVFDFGGGTFDVAILSIQGGIINVVAGDGDTHLGGEDFDNNLLKFCIQGFHAKEGINLMKGKNSTNNIEKEAANRILRRLKSECEQKKHDLSCATVVNIQLDSIYKELNLDIKITREQFENMNAKEFNRSITIVEKVLAAANMNKSEINEIVLVGGSTKIPKVQKLLSEYFEGKPLNKTVNPDEAVAHGAAILAAMINGNQAEQLKKIQFSDVAPLSIGIKLKDGEFAIIIPKNSPVPVSKMKVFYPADDNAERVEIIIFEGEEKVAIDNHLLGKFILQGIPPGSRDHQKIHVTMTVDKECILSVKAECPGTMISNHITITENKDRLSEAEIDRLRKNLKF